MQRLALHESKSGAGYVIVRAYHKSMRRWIHIAAVMAGEGQMDPDEIESMVVAVADTSALFEAFPFLTGVQLQLFAKWFDMEVNRDLKVRTPPERRRRS